MRQIINIFLNNSTKIIFIFLLSISLYLTIQSHSYHQSKLINSSSLLSGLLYEQTNSIGEYISLKEENDKLVRENAELRKLLFNGGITSNDNFTQIPNLNLPEIYKVLVSKVIHNQYNRKKNYLTIKGGSLQQVAKDMGVINSQGVVGIVENVSSNYSTVQSILNLNTKISAKIKKSNHFGTITWDGKNAGIVQLLDIPKLAPITKGDTIVTGGESIIFPEGIPIGTIEKVFQLKSSNFYVINVKLFNDMTSIKSLYIVENIHKEEIQQLEEKNADK